MIDDFMYVLENYPDVNLTSEDARRKIATALVNYMCEHHIISYTDLDAVKNDVKMINWIQHCKTQKEKSLDTTNIERGL